MGINFHPSTAPVIGYRVCDVTGGRSETVHPSYAEAGVELVRLRDGGVLLPGCTDDLYGPEGMYIDALTADGGADRDVEVGVSNSNARVILDALGLLGGVDFEDACCGSMDAVEFLGRILTALAVAPADAGVPWHEMPGTGATMTHCGRRPGYLQERLEQLHEMAQWCIERGRSVDWS